MSVVGGETARAGSAIDGEPGRRARIVIREADLEADLTLIADIVNASFGAALSLERFRWLYQDNPDGPAVAWLAIDDSTGQAVGTTAVCPRRVRIGPAGRRTTAWNCCDFSIQPRYRTMGAALKLRRAARAGIEAGCRDFLYAHPNERMLAVHLAAGHQPLGRMVRHAKLLRTSSGWRSIDRAASLALRAVGRDGWRPARHDAMLTADWPLGEFDTLFDRASSRLGTAVVRDARYVEWRFQRNPLERQEIIVARHGGRLSGYLIFTSRGNAAIVKDWLAADEGSVDALFRELIAVMRRRDAASISVMALESHLDLPRLVRLGFLRRPDTTTAVVFTRPALADAAMITDHAAWYMTLGDRDV